VANESLDALVLEQSDEPAFQPVADTRDPADVVAERDFVRRAALALTPEDAEVLFQTAVLDKPKREVARCMNVTPQAVSNRLRRIRQRLN
jgi:DNA-directed RNA polymerase specialized sigma24 family protein